MPNPRDMMRARHPDLFSDTIRLSEPQIRRAFFEYHLETLTNRKEEYDFEYFCRKLMEKEICPNLVIQTGPTGGGDGKVDSETYPVAQEIAERWWVGLAASSERWAFAFSAKKKWKPKLESDVANIVSTGRKYVHIYFVTNQFVKASKRSAQEDALLKRYGTPVHIIDRSWIVEKVFENNHIGLAVGALKIEVASGQEVVHGPRDVERLAELEELDKQTTDPDRYVGVRYQLVEDCLRSAILARGLERPRNEVEQRFALADKLAEEMDLRQQRLRIAYNRAWTAFWWFEDYVGFNKFYDEVEKRVLGTDLACDAELLLNLWQLLNTSAKSDRIGSDDAIVDKRRQALVETLESIANDHARPNNALQARASLNFIKLVDAFHEGKADQIEAVWYDFLEILDESKKLGDFPIEQLWKVISELGNIYDGPGFDELYEGMVDIIRQRRSEGEAGEAYVTRGLQKLNGRKPYEAIQWFGKAEAMLLKEECRGELVESLVLSSYAYEKVGLLWAARAKALAAVERSFATFIELGEMPLHALYASRRLVWIELQIGRIPSALNGILLETFIVAHLKLSEDRHAKFVDDLKLQDCVLGIHLLRLPSPALIEAECFPDALERAGLVVARMALLFALGQEQCLSDEGFIPDSETQDDVQKFFEAYLKQPVVDEISADPILSYGETSEFCSTILGSKIVLTTLNTESSFGVAESILAVFESFMATSSEIDVIPHRERVSVVIHEHDSADRLPQLHVSEPDAVVHVAIPKYVDFATLEDRQRYMVWLHSIIPSLISHMFMPLDTRAWLLKLAEQEQAFSRALAFGDALTLMRNVFGNTPKVLLSDWLGPSDKKYPFSRGAHWFDKHLQGSEPLKSDDRPLKFGSDLHSDELFDTSQRKHSDRRVLSPINMPLWSRAKWNGVAYGGTDVAPPFMGLIFEDGEAGKAIFQSWRDQWGPVDDGDLLRIVIVTGLMNSKPAEYAVIIGPNLAATPPKDRVGIMVSVSRVQRMTPSNTAHLNMFISEYKRFGYFYVIPAKMSNGTAEVFFDLAIGKRFVHIRPAWEIGPNDPDLSAVSDDDDPIIPLGVIDAPIAKAREWQKAMRLKRASGK